MIRPAILADEALGDAFAERHLAPVQSLGMELQETLRTYLDQGMKIEDTARALHVHANTLRHRLKRYEEATGTSLRDPRAMVELWWALERRRLRTLRAPPMRRFVVIAGLLLAAAAAVPAHAAVRPLAKIQSRTIEDGGPRFALAGETVLFGRTVGKTVRVYTVGVGSAASHARCFAPQAPTFRSSPRRSGRSSTSVTAGTSRTSTARRADRSPALARPSSRPRSPAAARSRSPRAGRALLDPLVREITLARYDVLTARFAGDLVAVERRVGDEDPVFPLGLVVYNWVTGSELYRATLPESIDQIILRADGRALVNAGVNTYDVVPGAAPRRLPSRATFAGDSLLAIDPGVHTFQILDPAGQSRPFGIPSLALDDWMADEQRAVWSANGCLLAAELGDPPRPSRAPAHACATSCCSSSCHRNPVPRTLALPLDCGALPEVAARARCNFACTAARPGAGRTSRFRSSQRGGERSSSALATGGRFRTARGSCSRRHLGHAQPRRLTEP